jgi:DNA replication protein DnaC
VVVTFVEDTSKVVFLGPPGVGKTMLAAGRYPKKLQTHLHPAVLIVDEVGHLPLSRTQANMVVQLISRRYERGSTIITGMGTAHFDLGNNLAGAPPPLPGRHGPLGGHMLGPGYFHAYRS